MIRYFVRPVAALLFVLALLYLGQAIGKIVSLPAWLGLDLDYVKSLDSEIGGSGLDALLVGYVAGMVASGFDHSHAAALQRASLRRRRRRDRSIDLSAELGTGASRLPLAGFAISKTSVTDCTVTAARFVAHPLRTLIANWFRTDKIGPDCAQLTEARFDGVQLSRVRFGGGSGGAKLDKCRFDHCTLVLCDFRNAVVTSDAGNPLFTDSTLIGCRFGAASFEHCNLSDVRVRWCSFWGARFDDSHMPSGLFEALEKAHCLHTFQDRPGYFEVIRISDLLQRPTIGRVWLLLRFVAGASFAKVSGR